MNKPPQTIILGVCGSIAAFKAADLTSKLTQAGYHVFVVMSENAAQFVTPLTFHTLSQNHVLVRMEDEMNNWKPSHIDLADRAGLLLIAPATANTIAKIACGIADDPLTSIALTTQAPTLIAPAMNGKMWANPITQENVERLKKRGTQFIDPDAGLLACGYKGPGRLADLNKILLTVEKLLASQKDLQNFTK